MPKVLLKHCGTIGAGSNQARAVKFGSADAAVIFNATGITDNAFPIFSNITDRSITEGDRIEFVLQASDADGDSIRYSSGALPPGAVFDSLNSRIFTWATDENSAGHYEISFLARDNRGGYDEEIVFIDVANSNQAPVIVSRFPSRADTTIAEGSLTMRVNAIDADGDPLSYRWYVNDEFAGSISNTFELSGDADLNDVTVLVFDLEGHNIDKLDDYCPC